MKHKLIILFLLISGSTFACECVEFNKENITELKKDVDYIIIGTVVDNINLNNNKFIESYWKKNNKYQEVTVKVERIIKGKLKSDYIYIYQIDAGNCARYFENGKKYVFTGHKIKKFINLTPNNKVDEISKDTILDEIPFVEFDRNEISNEEYKNKRMYLSNVEFDFENWNKLAKKKNIIRTNGCLSSTMESDFGKLIMNN